MSAVALLTLTLAVVPTAARAAAPVAAGCGDVLTSDAYLAADLSCSGNGLTLLSDMTLDLHGHKLQSSAGGTALSMGPEVHSLTIKNGTVQGWGTGLDPNAPDNENGADNRVAIDQVTFSGNSLAINTFETLDEFQEYGTELNISDSVFDANGRAIAGVFTGPIDIDNSAFIGNGEAVHEDTGGVHISASRFQRNAQALLCTEADCVLKDSQLHNNTVGVKVQYSTATLRGNSASRNQTAFLFDQAIVKVSDNVLDHNAAGLVLMSASGKVSGNRFVHNAVGYTASLQAVPSGVTLIRNSFVGNRDGIHTTEVGIGLGANKAVLNTGYGIYAPGATDLGGNRGYANARSPQCTGVVC